MNTFIKITPIAAILLLLSFHSFAEDLNSPKYEPHRGHQRYTAVIEEVIDVAYQGFRNVNYLVTWNGQQIIVPNVNMSVKKQKGEQLTFLVTWHELETKNGVVKNLGFSALE